MADLLTGLFFAAWHGLAVFGLCHLIGYLAPHWFEGDIADRTTNQEKT